MLTSYVELILLSITCGLSALAVIGCLALLFRSPARRLEELAAALARVEATNREEAAASRAEAAGHFRDSRLEVAESVRAAGEASDRKIGEVARLQEERLVRLNEAFVQGNAELRELLSALVAAFERQVAAKLDESREGSVQAALRLRQEIAESLRHATSTLVQTLDSIAKLQQEHLQSFARTLETLTTSNEGKLEQIRGVVDTKLEALRQDNAQRLDQMRATVDEKLQGTLEKRLGESFKQVSERLEQVHRGLGEMQTLATGVGDLKKVLTNVKSRGGWGEVQLGALLEQVLTPAQFERNVRTKAGSGETVEFAIRLPGPSDEPDAVVWLPVDSKFPVEDYQRLVEAQERADAPAMEESIKALRARVIQCAKDISTKYLNPPATTDFGIMFLPTEGLFAEVIRQPGLVEELQLKHRIVAAGPTTFAAVLNSLQMGFRTLSIQKQSSEVWKVLREVKSEFGKFGDSLEAVKKKLQEASNKMEDVGRRSRALERGLRGVEELPAATVATPTLDLAAVAADELLELPEQTPAAGDADHS